MKVAGIVAEYNPFHKGHEYQIKKIREMFGEDTGIVCVMSGDFVQRGEPAVFSKFARAEAAVSCGADLVIELPVHCSVASAERFAEGAVHILGRLGIVDYLVFGSESGNLDMIDSVANVLLSSEYHDQIREILKSGCSYPAARTKAVSNIIGSESVTLSPNDNLGIEYVKAIKRYGYPMNPVSILRKGAGHDQTYEGELKSGSEIRVLIHDGLRYSDFVPANAYQVYENEVRNGRNPISVFSLELPILSRLRMLSLNSISELPDAAEGLEQKLYEACRTGNTLTDIYDAVKSKRYTHARIRRMTMCAALGINKRDYDENRLYARVLALNERGATILRRSVQTRTVDVISKPAAVRELGEEQISLFEKCAAAHDLYVLGYDNVMMRKGDQDWKTSPVFVPTPVER